MHCHQSMLGVFNLLGGNVCCLSCELSLHPLFYPAGGLLRVWRVSPALATLLMPCMPDVLAAMHAVR